MNAYHHADPPLSTVWIYLFFLPFQLVDLFEWYAIPGVAIAAFIYLGFLASGEEIEQPFGTLFSFLKQLNVHSTI